MLLTYFWPNKYGIYNTIAQFWAKDMKQTLALSKNILGAHSWLHLGACCPHIIE
jgi:hypothetical protein